MRLLLASTAIALLFGLSPASAMCGGGQQAGGAMCGAPSAANKMTELDDWPTAPSQAKPEQKSGMAMGGCACCKNMAMMDGKMMDGKKSDDPHKGMDMK